MSESGYPGFKDLQDFCFLFRFLWADLQGMGLLNKIFDGESIIILFMLIQIFLSSFTEFSNPQNLVIIKNI
ncbi:hypothetical protein [Anabaena catenula]|uniref:Uncharacterized protein n=1 Tax=Anabaena catenula FACHB-362 TaxID=2692877 RepID=A0ABR8J6Y0_9NOST|nr:hypothetical protein [Anabaena catenula]MBD2692786.1 hypothetical protein [Anabaena catenula FACHB-362]